MHDTDHPGLDLMPPAFAEGLEDWSRGDGTPDSPTYETAENGRLARGDADFGDCLEIRLDEAVQRLRYMGEVPVRPGVRLEVAARLKAVRGPLPRVRIAASPGGDFGAQVSGLPTTAPPVALPGHGQVVEIGAIIAAGAAAGGDLVWDDRVRYAHVGLDLIGSERGVVRIASVTVRAID